MALLKFNKGLLANLNKTAKSEGNVYITTDSKEMYVDISADTRISIGKFRVVATEAALTALEATEGYSTESLYYVEGSKLLKKWNGTEFVALNDTSSLSTIVSSHTTRIENLETKMGDVIGTSGAVKADKVDTTQTITVTTPVGNYKAGKKIPVTNVQKILLDMLCQDIDPEKVNPTISITLTGAGAYEVGTKVTPKYSISTNKGKYTVTGQNDQDSGVTFSGFSAAETNRADGSQKTLNTQSGTFVEMVVTDAMAENNGGYYLKAAASSSDGSIPKSFLGNEVTSKQIKAASLSADSAKITGFRPIFYGEVNDTNEINSAYVRDLKTTGKAAANGSIYFTATASSKRFIVAIPTSSKKKITSAKITSSMNADATSNYKKQSATVAVEGAAGYTETVPYDIWIYQPASIDSTEKHTVTIG